MNKLLLVMTLILGMDMASARDVSELSDPIVAYVGVIAKHANTLALTDVQQAELKSWKAVAQPKREAMEDKVVQVRTQLRDMINTGAPKIKRVQLANKIGRMEAQLVMLRSNCTDHWRKVLTPEQFGTVVELAKSVTVVK